MLKKKIAIQRNFKIALAVRESISKWSNPNRFILDFNNVVSQMMLKKFWSKEVGDKTTRGIWKRADIHIANIHQDKSALESIENGIYFRSSMQNNETSIHLDIVVKHKMIISSLNAIAIQANQLAMNNAITKPAAHDQYHSWWIIFRDREEYPDSLFSPPNGICDSVERSDIWKIHICEKGCIRSHSWALGHKNINDDVCAQLRLQGIRARHPRRQEPHLTHESNKFIKRY